MGRLSSVVLLVEYHGHKWEPTYVTAPISVFATSAHIRRALEDLPTVGAGSVAVRRSEPSPQQELEWTVSFVGSNVRGQLPLLIPNTNFTEDGGTEAALGDVFVKSDAMASLRFPYLMLRYRWHEDTSRK